MRNRAEEGVSLIELLVALTVLGIVMAGVTATVASSLRVTSESTAVTAASGLATSSIEEALAQEFADLEDEVTTPQGPQTEVINNRTFTVTRQVTWVSSADTTGACVGVAGAGDANVLLVDVSVDWAGARNSDIVSQQTTVSPPVGLYDPNEGSMAIYVSDAQEPSQPVSGVTVTIDGPSGIQTATTGTDGCAVFQELLPGDYDVDVEKPGHIDIDQRVAPNVTRTIGVGPGERVPFEFRYSPQEFIDVSVTSAAQFPAEALTVTAINTRDAWPVATVSSSSPTQVPLWPDQYQFFVGQCDAADPEGLRDGSPIWPTSATRPPAVQTSAVAGAATAPIPAGTVEIQWDAAWPVGLNLNAVAVSDDQCPSSDAGRIDLGTVTSGTVEQFTLPFGNWRIDVDGPGAAPAQSPLFVLAPGDTSANPAVVPYTGPPGSVCQVPSLRGTFAEQPSATGNDDQWSLTLPTVAPDDVIFVVAFGTNSRNWLQSSGYRVARITELNPEMTVWAKVAAGGETTVQFDAGSNRPYVTQAFVMQGLDTSLSNIGNPRSELERKTDSRGGSYGPYGGLNVQEDDSLFLLFSAAEDNGGLLGQTISPSGLSEIHMDIRTNDLMVGVYGSTENPSTTGDYQATYDLSFGSGAEQRHMVMLVYDPECS